MSVPLQYFAPGAVIFKEGDPGSTVFVVKSGKVKLVKGAQEVPLAEIGESGIFGEMALVDKSDRSATAIAMESTYCYQISRMKFEERLQSADPFVRGMFRVLVGRLRDTSAQLQQLQDSKKTA